MQKIKGKTMGVAEFSRQLSRTDRSDLIAYGREVIETEAEALNSLVGALDDNFARAVTTILNITGRLVTTGIGKSGYIARKFSATLASTGTPSLYVHPVEAAHGDLGMLMAGDGLLAFSNSGSTAELQPILDYAAKLGLSVIGIASKADSLLMRQADVKLLLPRVDEACPANLAPTTSTAMMMALGDALAMTTMRARGVSTAGFAALHPGGTIGKRLMRVAAIMHRESAMPFVAPETSMRDVIVTMTSMSFGIAGVVDESGALIGVITDGDLRRHLDGLMDATAADVMTCDPVWVSPGTFVEDALTAMNTHKITAMFAIEDAETRRPVGLVHVHDFLRLGIA
ncbi:KpsF/GutQ family sugar-phosphate isomerase [Sphingomonas sp.]|uniref:KpsF/GutQ family sugar-phosphate isomerase n=1 Tax=Sphingomonas sp. TaxID=28214 RepID=UPI003B3AB1CE